MPKEIQETIQLMAVKIGSLLGLPKEFFKIIIQQNEDYCSIWIHRILKDLAEQYDNRGQLSFSNEGISENLWLLKKDKWQTEKYNLLGILSAAYADIDVKINIKPSLERIQTCLNKTISRIKDSCNISIMAIPNYHKEKDANGKEKIIFTVEIEINSTQPITISHEDPDILIQVVTAGIPNVIKKITSGK